MNLIALRSGAAVLLGDVPFEITYPNTQRGDLLAEIVMQFPSEASALLLLCIDQAPT